MYCKITLVHGTWGRGFFPDTLGVWLTKLRNILRWRQRRPRWFEAGSQFHDQLTTTLNELSVQYTIGPPFTWSGSNSVFERRSAAAKLADRLKAELSLNPNYRSIVIAHSHGGNVALRSLEYIAEYTSRIDVITLATPFLRVCPVETVEGGLWFFLGIPFSMLVSSLPEC
jgi:hypothetical protein